MFPDVDAWDAWHPTVPAERLAGFDAPWYVAGGWAIDLFLGEATRPHGDLEFAIPDGRFDDVVSLFPELSFAVPFEGAVYELNAESLGRSHQAWAWEPPAGVWRFDVFREPHRDGRWVCRRDPRICLPYNRIIESGKDGVPFLAPEVVLLFKAKATREKDVADLRAVLPRLGAQRAQWLIDALALVHPGHAWSRDLEEVVRGKQRRMSDSERLQQRADNLLPEELAAGGSQDPTAQAEAILRDSDAREAFDESAPDLRIDHRTSEESAE
jgi:hypothetical protein